MDAVVKTRKKMKMSKLFLLRIKLNVLYNMSNLTNVIN